jgi:small-conductance mechanosensitive channel/CRP-like cAMP-binding protein
MGDPGGLDVNVYLRDANAALVCLVIYLAALALGGLVRRVLKKDRPRSHPLSLAFRGLAASVVRPLLVLALTQIVLWLLRRMPTAADWIIGHPAHVLAWNTFWVGVLVVFLAEALACQFFALRRRPFPVPDLLLGIIRALLVLAILFAVLRGQLGINIAPLLASTALITAVVGFALQGVLGNLLAGMSLHIVRTVLPQDWVIIGDVEGQVVQTNWRETRLRSRDGHLLIVPNSKVAESLINNIARPEPRRRHILQVGASYEDAPDDVIAALVAAARSVPDVMQEPAPDAFIVAYLDFGINYRLRFWTDQYSRRAEIEGNVNRMIWYQFKRRGIEIPFPMSDKLLNDFMDVLAAQRNRPPEREQVDSAVSDLMNSGLCRTLCVGEDGRSLLGDEALRRIAPSTRRVLYTRGETLFRQGEEGETFYIVVRGRLKGRIDREDGTPPTEFELGAGAVVGEMSLLTGLPRTATVAAVESAELLEFDKEAFGLVLAANERIPEILSVLAAERAASNAADFDRLRKMQADASAADLKQPNILKRLLRMIRGAGS